MMFNKLIVSTLFLFALSVGFMSCEKTPELRSKTYTYSFNTGQVAAAFAYNTTSGTHATNLSATLVLDEMEGGSTKVTVTLNNAVDGQMYAIHAHDAADATTTPNGTPYNETPNGLVFAQMTAAASGNTATASQTSTMSYDDLMTSYDGFFVVHDPLQAISTTDPTTYVILGSFAR